MSVMVEATVVVYLFLFAFTAVVVAILYKRTREGSREYVRAKTILEDVILSFRRDLQVQEEGIQDIADRSEKAGAENVRMIEELSSEVLHIGNEVQDLGESQQKILKEFELLAKRVDDLVPGWGETLEKVGAVESLGKAVGISPVAMVPSIGIRREQALAPLTETELRILQLLATEGDKTAPQIRNVIGLTREHTARLMKKLYVGGYIERRTKRTPYVYTVKKEMKNLLSSGEDSP